MLGVEGEQVNPIREANTVGKKNAAKILALFGVRVDPTHTNEQYEGVISDDLGPWLEALDRDASLRSSKAAVLHDLQELILSHINDASDDPIDKNELDLCRTRINTLNVEELMNIKSLITSSFAEKLRSSKVYFDNVYKSVLAAISKLDQQRTEVNDYIKSLSAFQYDWLCLIYRLICERAYKTGMTGDVAKDNVPAVRSSRNNAPYLDTTANIKGAIEKVLNSVNEVVSAGRTLSMSSTGSAVMKANFERLYPSVAAVSIPMNRLHKFVQFCKAPCSLVIDPSTEVGRWFNDAETRAVKSNHFAYMRKFFKEAADEGSYTTVFKALLVAYSHSLLLTHLLLNSALIKQGHAAATFANDVTQAAFSAGTSNRWAKSAGLLRHDGIAANHLFTASQNGLLNTFASEVSGGAVVSALTDDFASTGGAGGTVREFLVAAAKRMSTDNYKSQLIKAHREFIDLAKSTATSVNAANWGEFSFVSEGYGTEAGMIDVDTGNTAKAIPAAGFDLSASSNSYIGSRYDLRDDVLTEETFKDAVHVYNAVNAVFVRSMDEKFGLNSTSQTTGDSVNNKAANQGGTGRGKINNAGADVDFTLDILIPDSDIRVLDTFNKVMTSVFDDIQFEGSAVDVKKDDAIVLKGNINTTGAADSKYSVAQAIDAAFKGEIKTDAARVKMTLEDEKQFSIDRDRRSVNVSALLNFFDSLGTDSKKLATWNMLPKEQREALQANSVFRSKYPSLSSTTSSYSPYSSFPSMGRPTRYF